jgi:hypothetical protein
MLASVRPGHSATRELSHTALVLAMPRPRKLAARLLGLALLLVVAAGAGWLARGGLPEMLRPPVATPAAPPVEEPLRRELAQAHEALRLAQARSTELERQIDTLNQRLREATEELTFFRKARDGRR